MEYTARFFALLFFGLILFILQTSGAFSFFGIHPNFILVFFIALVVFSREHLFLVLCFFILIMAFITRFWMLDAGVFSVIILFCFTVRKFLTGRVLPDLFVLLFISTGLFFFGNPLVSHIAEVGFNFSEFSFLPFRSFFLEFFLNTIVGILFVFLADRRPLSFIFGK